MTPWFTSQTFLVFKKRWRNNRPRRSLQGRLTPTCVVSKLSVTPTTQRRRDDAVNSMQAGFTHWGALVKRNESERIRHSPFCGQRGANGRGGAVDCDCWSAVLSYPRHGSRWYVAGAVTNDMVEWLTDMWEYAGGIVQSSNKRSHWWNENDTIRYNTIGRSPYRHKTTK